MSKIPMLEKFAAQSLVEHNGEFIFSKEKFAELIVRECIAQCNDGDSRWFIAQHFGVEE